MTARRRNLVQENSVPWNEFYVEWVSLENVFGQSTKKRRRHSFIKSKDAEELGIFADNGTTRPILKPTIRRLPVRIQKKSLTKPSESKKE